jgi:hypothetical protein
MERAVVRGHRAPGGADSSAQELAALVEHALRDYLSGPEQEHFLEERLDVLRRSTHSPRRTGIANGSPPESGRGKIGTMGRD